MSYLSKITNYFKNLSFSENNKTGIVSLVRNVNGWITVSTDLNNPPKELCEAIGIYEKNIILKNERHWMQMVCLYARHELMVISNLIKQEEFLVAQKLKRCVTVSALSHGIEIPQSLWLLDTQTCEMYLRYCAMHRLKAVDVDTAGLSEYIAVGDLEKLTTHALKNTQFIKALWSNKVSPNIHVLMQQAEFKLPKDCDRMKGYQKVLTCLFLKAGMPLPADYIYLDVEAHDYISHSDRFEDVRIPIMRPQAS